MGFMDGIRDVLGGFNAVKRINYTGFDWREQDAAQQFARDRQREVAQQQDEDRALKIGEDVMAGAEGDQMPDVSALFPAGMDQQKQRLYIESLAGRTRERKSNLKAQEAINEEALQRLKGTQKKEQIMLTRQEAEAVARTRAAIAAGQKPSPRDE